MFKRLKNKTGKFHAQMQIFKILHIQDKQMQSKAMDLRHNFNKELFKRN